MTGIEFIFVPIAFVFLFLESRLLGVGVRSRRHVTLTYQGCLISSHPRAYFITTSKDHIWAVTHDRQYCFILSITTTVNIACQMQCSAKQMSQWLRWDLGEIKCPLHWGHCNYHIVSLAAKRSNCVRKWLVVNPIYISTTDTCPYFCSIFVSWYFCVFSCWKCIT